MSESDDVTEDVFSERFEEKNQQVWKMPARKVSVKKSG